MKTDIERAGELLAAEYDKAGEKLFASRARSGHYDNDPDIRAIAAPLRAAPDGAMSLLREVCEQLDAVGCGACTGSYAPMEDLHGRIAAYLAPGATLSTVTPPRDLRTKLGDA